jgi:eukaryotic-like serine/threonine-protein kinase
VTATMSAAPLAPGTQIAPGYEVVAHLSRNRTLDVYDVWSEHRDCGCIAKTLRPDRVDQARSRDRLLREGAILECLSHPHLVRAYETAAGDDGPVVILETLTGETLSVALHRTARRLPWVDTCFLGLHLCSAVRYLHAEGWLHTDLKPSNVIVEAGRAKVIDLSIARRPGERCGPGSGTRQYAPPEQARGEELGPAADVWGIGGILLEALTRRQPFAGCPHEGPFPALTRRPPRVAELRRVPPALAGIVDACLQAGPAARPAVAELAEVLDELLGP